MWFLEQVTIICLAQFIMIPSTHTKPRIYLNNNQAQGNNKYSLKNYLTPVKETKDFKRNDTKSESILKAFNFHEIEYPVAATPRPHQFYFQDNYNQSPQINFISDTSNRKINSDLKSARNRTFNNLQKSSKPRDLVLPKKFTSGFDFRNVNFPDVEYPLSAKETWKPNYWSIPSGSKDINAYLSEDSCLANIYPTSSSGIKSKSGKCRPFSIKSNSDIIKNKERLKQVLENKANNTSNKQNNATCRNDSEMIINCKENFAANDIETLLIENTEQELHTTAIPYYFTPIDILPDCEEFNIDVSNIFSVFNKNNENNIPSISLQNQSTILMKSINDDVSLKRNHEIDYDLFDIIDVRKPETSSDLCGLDEDYTTDIYSEDNNNGWFSHPITTPTPFSAPTVDLTWKNCKIFTPCEYNANELEDYYISV